MSLSDAPAPRPTMTDIAKRVGVSQSTVSLVLNRMTGAKVSPATREKVVAVATELGYALPQRRGALRAAAPTAAGARRHVVAYLADELSTTAHPAVTIDGARAAAWEHNCLVAVYATGAARELEAAAVDAALADPATIGVLYATVFTRQVELPPRLARSKLPCVLLNCYTAKRQHASVVPGEVGGGFAATEHLLAQGHRRIGFINGEPWMDAARDRLKGYRQALATADLPFDAALVRHGDWMSGTGFEHALALMRIRRPPTAIFCANDLMALGAIEALKQLGRAVPGDVAVIGYDDLEMARHAHPPLSTVMLPSFAMGQWATERLLEEAASARPLPPRLVKMDCPLVPRESAGEASAARS